MISSLYKNMDGKQINILDPRKNSYLWIYNSLKFWIKIVLKDEQLINVDQPNKKEIFNTNYWHQRGARCCSERRCRPARPTDRRRRGRWYRKLHWGKMESCRCRCTRGCSARAFQVASDRSGRLSPRSPDRFRGRTSALPWWLSSATDPMSALRAVLQLLKRSSHPFSSAATAENVPPPNRTCLTCYHLFNITSVPNILS